MPVDKDKLIEVTVPFDGQWLPDADPAKIGAKNYKTLQNLRYNAEGGIEGVQGYTRVNTTALTTYTKINNGHQLRTPGRTLESYVLVHSEHATPASYESRVYQNQTAIGSQGNFQATVLHTDATYSLTGRFSDAPQASIAYCNKKESCIWSGNEMRIGGLFTVSDITVSRDDIALNATPNPDTITTTNGNFLNYGFKAGQTITVSGADTAANDGDYDIVSISTDGKTITITDGDLAGDDAAGATTVTIVADADTDYFNPIDYTDAANNDLQTAGNVIYIGGGIDDYTVLMLDCDGTNKGTTFTDSSASGHTVTANGDAQTDTSQAKFGTASGLFDGISDYLSAADHANWFMDTGTVTIDFWVRFNSLPIAGTFAGFFSQRVDNNNNVQGYIYHHPTSGYQLFLHIEDAGSIKDIGPFTISTTPIVNTWYHVAFIRGWGGTANNFAITWNGVEVGNETASDNWPDLAASFEIGRMYNEGSTCYNYFNGWIDEFRVSKGIARWTANFTPPIRAYQDSQSRWYLFTTRPIQGFKAYVKTANATTSTLTGKEWTGRSFSSLTLTDNTSPDDISMAQTGTVTFSSTVSTCKPWHFEGLYLYAYLFELSAGSCELYNVTVDAPFQSIVDVWDGVYRQPILFQFWDDSAGYFIDYTNEVNYASDPVSPIGAIINLMTSSDYLLIAFEERTSAILFEMLAGLVNANAATIAVYYWNGTQCVTVGDIQDSVHSDLALKAFSQTGQISWYPPSEGDEAEKTQFGKTGYFYKITVSATLSDLGADDVTIDVVTGIPAQTTVKPFKFPAMYKNRLMLCGYTEGKEGNRMDYSITDSPNVWNGEETSMDGKQSLYFGGSDDLTGAVQLYNRFGANIFSLLLVLKANETYILTGDGPTGDDPFRIFPISLNIGCPAPLTLVATETGFEMEESIKRNVVIWLSYSGPIIFDGAVLHPIHGIKKYFDPVESVCINFAYIDKARAWFDSTYNEYNLLIPSGSSQTTCNVWLVYNLILNRWYTKDTGAAGFPQMGFPVIDAYGTRYIYGGIDTGYMIQFENSNTWYVNTGIEQIVETGDFFPSGESWYKTRIKTLKVAAKTITEDQDLAIAHYADTGTVASTPALTSLALDSGSNRIVRDTQGINRIAWTHRFGFSVTTSDTEKGLQPILWGYQYRIEREDL